MSLRLVPPAQPLPFEMEMFAFAKISGDIFVCHKGEWMLAREAGAASDALLEWVRAIAAQLPNGPLDEFPAPLGAA